MTSSIVTSDQLDSLCKQAKSDGCLAIDTEFMRVRTYYPRLCLIQVAVGEQQWIIDVLQHNQLDQFAEIWADPAVTKVMHSARQDVEVMQIALGCFPRAVFDTQIALGLLAESDQAGYATMVMEMFDVTLDKSHTRSDWCARPLSDQQLSYALDDVKYLLPARQNLEQQLQQKRRLDWHHQECEALISPSLYGDSSENAYLRLGRAKSARLPAQGQRVLKALANWREHCAQNKDLPRTWVAKDDVLYLLAEHCPVNNEQLATVINGQEQFIKRYGSKLLKLINTELAASSQHEVWTQPQRMEQTQVKQVKQLMKRLGELSEKLGVAKTMLSTKRDVEQLVLGNTATRIFNGWREQVVGQPLSEAFRLMSNDSVTLTV